MKTIKLNFLLVILALGVFTFTSCEDEFTEEDFLDKQAELAATQHGYDLEKLILQASLDRANDSARQALQQAIVDYQKAGNEEALAKAGLLLSYTVRIESDGKPVEGATISVSNAATGGRTMDAVSDASGNATITSGVPVGRNVIRFSGTGYYSMRGVVEFDPMGEDGDYAVVGNVIYPIGRNESSTLEVFSSDAGSVATVKGVVTIETDLTNSASEIPQGLVISATFDEDEAEVGGTEISNLKFESSSIGSAAVDAETGAYTLVLPARLEGIDYDLEYSDLTLDQKIAITYRNNKKLAAPEYAMVPTRFIANGEGGASDEVEVSGARIVFPAPPAAGQGLKASAFVARPKAMNANLVDFQNESIVETANSFIFKLGSRGVLKKVPTMAITGGGATTNATAEAYVEGYATSVSVTAAGTGFGDKQDVTITVAAVDKDAINLGTVFTLTVKSNADGTLTVGAVNIAGAGKTGSGYDANNPFEFNDYTGMTGLTATVSGAGTGATASVDYTGYLTSFQINTSGQNLTSVPTITFTDAGEGGTVPTVTVPYGYFTYEFSLDNSANTVDYSVLPASIEFLVSDEVDNGIPYPYLEDEVDMYLFGSYINDDIILNLLTVDGGKVVPTSSGAKFRIGSYTMPTAVVKANTVEAASAVAIINENGQLEDITITNHGDGYASTLTAEVVVQIEGAPGSGAAITLTNFGINSDGSVDWNGGYSISAPGSGYLQNLNQAFIEEGEKSFDADYNGVTLKPGDVIINNVNYGTGERTQNVSGEEDEDEEILD